MGHSKSTSGGSSGTLHGGRNETASALERIEDCIDFSGQKTGDYNGLVSVLLHHQYSAEVVEVRGLNLQGGGKVVGVQGRFRELDLGCWV